MIRLRSEYLIILSRCGCYILIIAILSSCSSDDKINFKHSFIYGENDRTFMGFAFGDLNGDELIDLVVHEGGSGGPLKWYEQTISGYWIDNIIADSGDSGIHFSSGDLDIGDIDNDGDIDVIGFEHPGERQDNYLGDTLSSKIYWFENNGAGTLWKSHYIGVVEDFVRNSELTDFDRDGNLDLVTITFRDENNLSIFRQSEPDNWQHVQSLYINNIHEGMDCGDIDGDGDFDIAANGYWIQNPGENLYSNWNIRSINIKWHNQTDENRKKNATKIKCADIDNDGRDEVFISHSENAGYPIAWYDSDNPESGNWKEFIIAEGFTGVRTLDVGDINNDGALDILIGENGSHFAEEDDSLREVRLFLNRGNNFEWKEVFLSNDGLYNGILLDVNNDGFLDICGAAGNAGNPYEIWLTNL